MTLTTIDPCHKNQRLVFLENVADTHEKYFKQIFYIFLYTRAGFMNFTKFRTFTDSQIQDS